MSFTKDEIRRSMLLYAVTDRMWLKEGESLVPVVERVLESGATFLQIREKDLDETAFEAEAERLRTLCAGRRIPFVVNDSVEIALRCGADGVHVGQSDIRGRDLRAILGPDRILGISAGTVEEAVAAERAGADYIGVGAVFATGTKKDAVHLTMTELKAIRAAVEIPVVAIGGIHAGNIARLAETGVDGVAVVSAIFGAEDPGEATAELRALTENTLWGRGNRCAIFDMDGTLVDSMGYWQQLGREFLLSKGVTGDLEEVLQRTIPMTMLESAELFCQEFDLSGTAEEIAAEMNAAMEDHYRSDIPLKSGTAAYLERLHRAGVTMCVASATPEILMRACLERLRVAGYFRFLISCDAVGAGKDRPDVYLAAAERLGAPPEAITVYEDAPYAARTARAAGFHVVGVYDESSAAKWEKMREIAHCTLRDWQRG